MPQCYDARSVAVALVSKWCPNAKMYDSLPLLWSRSGAPIPNVRFDAVALVSKWCPNAMMYDLLPLLWSRSGAPMLRCTICCRCFGLEVVPQWKEVRFVAVAVVSKWCPNAKMYDLLPLLWSRTGAPMLRRTICCRCFGLDVVPQFQDV